LKRLKPRHFFQAVSLQLSGILGAGIFVLPYVFQQSNFAFTVFGLIALTAILAQIHLFYCDIINRTPGDHQLAGYAQIYFGRRLRNLALLNIFLLGIGLLYAYIKLASSFLTTITSLTPVQSSAVFLVAVSCFHLIQTKVFQSYNKIIPAFAVIIVFTLLSIALQIPPFPASSPSPSFAFFGPLVFALTGFTIIPEVEEFLRPYSRPRRHLRLSTLLGLFSAALIYLFYSYSIGKISGPYLTADSVTGLGHVSLPLAKMLSVLGLLLVFEASLNYLMVIKETFYRDIQLSLFKSNLLAFAIFFFSFLFIKSPLLSIISLTGSVTILISAFIICLIRLKIRNTPLDLIKAVSILFLFFVGFLSEIFQIFP